MTVAFGIAATHSRHLCRSCNLRLRREDDTNIVAALVLLADVPVDKRSITEVAEQSRIETTQLLFHVLGDKRMPAFAAVHEVMNDSVFDKYLAALASLKLLFEQFAAGRCEPVVRVKLGSAIALLTRRLDGRSEAGWTHLVPISLRRVLRRRECVTCPAGQSDDE